MKIISDIRCTEYSRPGHPERPQRISRTLERLREQKELQIEWVEPTAPSEEAILRAHSREHWQHLNAAEQDFDGDTPAYPKIFEHAMRSVGAAIDVLKLGLRREPAFSLIRPPGHHATRDHAMGFCYLNSVAIATLEAISRGAERVAVFDFDVHHGNGTEAILLENPHCAYFSVHQYPGYPGTGQQSRENAHNFPVLPGSSRETYQAALKRAIDAIAKYKPTVLGISAGFDAYCRDPLSDEPLQLEDFHWLGESIKKFDLPTFSLLEGGYSSDLPDLIFAYLKGLSGA